MGGTLFSRVLRREIAVAVVTARVNAALYTRTSRNPRWMTTTAASSSSSSSGGVLLRAQEQAGGMASKMEDDDDDYSAWSRERLVERIGLLERERQGGDNVDRKTRSSPTHIGTTPSLNVQKTTTYKKKKPRAERVFDPARYSTRFIALKLAYLGKRYNGFEYHAGNPTPLPTIEEELWKALNRARLIFPARDTHPLRPGEVDWEGAEYSKCGRTDKGVSAFGQVVGIRVRSNRPLGGGGRKEVGVKEEGGVREERRSVKRGVRSGNTTGSGDLGSVLVKEGEDSLNTFNTLARQHGIELAAPPLAPSRGKVEGEEEEEEEDAGVGQLTLDDQHHEEALNFDPVADEIPYASLLNRLLPPDIRILAWCPSPPLDFSARFSCRERRYRYFFTQPAFSPTPHNLELAAPSENSQQAKDGWLDIEAMREAAKSFEGTRDFRNFCKVDGGKQISNFERRIFHADIEEVEDLTGSLGYVHGLDFLPPRSNEVERNSPRIYTFTLHGSAFLWHQVRHMVAILFLVGQGLEKPSIVAELLDVKKNPRRPTYEMAADTPLVLWDCIFPHENDAERKDAMQWLYVGDPPSSGEAKYGTGGLVDDLWTTWRERKIDEMLAGTLLGVVAKQGRKVEDLSPRNGKKGSKSQRVFDGGDAPRQQGVYVPVMQKPLLESVEVINEKYAVRKGFESAEDMKKQGFRRLNKPSIEDS